jgi:hypothetical protein
MIRGSGPLRRVFLARVSQTRTTRCERYRQANAVRSVEKVSVHHRDVVVAGVEFLIKGRPARRERKR